jgi:hypothetical protein
MTPAIPAGRAARTAWRRLDRQTKAEVLRRAADGQGHPDPEVAAVAVGFARWELNYPLWVQVAIVLVLLLAAVFLDSLSPRPPVPIVTVTLLVALGILWRGPAQQPREAGADGAGQPRRPRRRSHRRRRQLSRKVIIQRSRRNGRERVL